MSKLAIYVAISLLAAGSTRADVIEIPLPGLAGFYAEPNALYPTLISHREVTIDLGGPVAQVNGASIRWSGNVAAGWGRDSGGGYFRWVGGIKAWLESSQLARWQTRVNVDSPPWEISFDATQPLTSFNNADWEFLYDGTGVIDVAIYHASYLQGEMVAAPTATIDEATLVLDVTFATTPVEPTTWGRVKALYRR